MLSPPLSMNTGFMGPSSSSLMDSWNEPLFEQQGGVASSSGSENASSSGDSTCSSMADAGMMVGDPIASTDVQDDLDFFQELFEEDEDDQQQAVQAAQFQYQQQVQLKYQKQSDLSFSTGAGSMGHSQSSMPNNITSNSNTHMLSPTKYWGHYLEVPVQQEVKVESAKSALLSSSPSNWNDNTSKSNTSNWDSSKLNSSNMNMQMAMKFGNMMNNTTTQLPPLAAAVTAAKAVVAATVVAQSKRTAASSSGNASRRISLGKVMNQTNQLPMVAATKVAAAAVAQVKNASTNSDMVNSMNMHSPEGGGQQEGQHWTWLQSQKAMSIFNHFCDYDDTAADDTDADYEYAEPIEEDHSTDMQQQQPQLFGKLIPMFPAPGIASSSCIGPLSCPGLGPGSAAACGDKTSLMPLAPRSNHSNASTKFTTASPAVILAASLCQETAKLCQEHTANHGNTTQPVFPSAASFLPTAAQQVSSILHQHHRRTLSGRTLASSALASQAVGAPSLMNLFQSSNVITGATNNISDNNTDYCGKPTAACVATTLPRHNANNSQVVATAGMKRPSSHLPSRTTVMTSISEEEQEVERPSKKFKQATTTTSTTAAARSLLSNYSTPLVLTTHKSEALRETNKMHARNARLRKKAYTEALQEQLLQQVAERDADVRAAEVEAERKAETRRIRQKVLQAFLKLRSHYGAKDAERKWSCILEPEFTLRRPTYSHNGGETVLKGVSTVVADRSEEASHLLSRLAPTKSLDVNQVTFEYQCEDNSFLMDRSMCSISWKGVSRGAATALGVSSEVALFGSLRAQFHETTNRLLSATLIVDTGAACRQIRAHLA